MNIRKLIHLPELHFVEWIENSYKVKKNTVQLIDHWLWERGIVSPKKRRQYAVEFISSSVNDGGIYGDENDLKNKLDDFWLEIGFRKLLSI